jgi:hypothetical protein
MQYRDDMTDEERSALLVECDALDRAYADAADMDAANIPLTEDQVLEAEAAEEGSLAYFDRYVAGDRRRA